MRDSRKVLVTGAGALVFLIVLALFPAPARTAGKEFPKGLAWGTAISGFQTEPGGRRRTPTSAATGAWVRDAENIDDGASAATCPSAAPGSGATYESDLDLARDRLTRTRLPHVDRVEPDLPALDARRRRRRRRRRLASCAGSTSSRTRRRSRTTATCSRASRRADCEPFVTLSHFSLPLWIHDPIAVRDAFAGVGPTTRCRAASSRAGWLDRRHRRRVRASTRAYLAWKFGDLVDTVDADQRAARRDVSGYVNIRRRSAATSRRASLLLPGAIAAVQNLLRANAAAYDEIHRLRDRTARRSAWCRT